MTAVFTLLTAHAFFFMLAFVGTLAGIRWVRENQEKQAAREFGVFLLFVLFWIVGQFGELFVGATHAYYLSLTVEALRACLAISWFYFVLTFAGYRDVVRSFSVRVLVVAGAAYLLLFTVFPPVAMNYTFTAVTLPDPFVTVALADSTLYGQLAIVVGYLFIAVGSIGLLYRLVMAEYTQWWQPATIGTALLLVIVTDAFPRLFEPLVAGIDYSGAGAAFVGLLFIMTVYRRDEFGFVPVARAHIVESIDDPVVVFNPDHVVIDHNTAAETLFACEEAIGRPIEETLPEPVTDVDLDSPDDDTTTRSLTVHGERKHFDVSVDPISDAGANAGSALILTDVTTLRQRTRDLERQTEQLNEFASIVSHDLRNPLLVARGRAEQLDGDDTQAIQESLTRMENIIEDSLTLAREGRALDEQEWIDLGDVVTDAWETSKTDAATLESAVPPGIAVYGDRSRLRTLFENLFRNSTDHGPADVTVRVGLLSEEDGFFVEDTGDGIRQDERDRIFEKGYSTAEDGTGFGMAIVGAVVDAHGWEIHVTESTTGGARFEFRSVELQEERG